MDRLKYYIKCLGETSDDAGYVPDSIDNHNCTLPFVFARAAASHFYHYRVGQKLTWPIVFTIITQIDKHVTEEIDYSIALVIEPQFFTSEISRECITIKQESSHG